MKSKVLAAKLDGLSLGAWRYLESVSSTNDAAQAWAQCGAPDFSLVLAEQQTAGRGRLNHTWFSLPEASLTFSLIFHPTQAEIPYLAHFAALGAVSIYQALHDRYGLEAEIKWPNDVLIGRKKVCGILVENSWMGDRLQSLIMGIGINVGLPSIPPIDQQAYPATCLESVLGAKPDRFTLLHDILFTLQTWRGRLCSSELLEFWDAHLAFKHEWVTIIEADGSQQHGQVIGLTAQGNLHLCNDQGQEWSVLAGDVRQG